MAGHIDVAKVCSIQAIEVRRLTNSANCKPVIACQIHDRCRVLTDVGELKDTMAFQIMAPLSYSSPEVIDDID